MIIDKALASFVFAFALPGTPVHAQSACPKVSGYTRTCRLSSTCVVRLSGPGVPSVDVSGCPEIAARGLCRKARPAKTLTDR